MLGPSREPILGFLPINLLLEYTLFMFRVAIGGTLYLTEIESDLHAGRNIAQLGTVAKI